MTHHSLDPYPIPKDHTPLFVNEPSLIDKTLLDSIPHTEDHAEDNVRIYVPLDINREAILRRLENIIAQYGEANEENEYNFQTDVGMIISQLEIYDQIWYVRHMPEKGGAHSREGKALARDIVALLEEIPDGCAECFPFEMIEVLRDEYDK